jgi:hypothetical protein
MWRAIEWVLTIQITESNDFNRVHRSRFMWGTVDGGRRWYLRVLGVINGFTGNRYLALRYKDGKPVGLTWVTG